MIVPVIFTLLSIRSDAPHLWFFYKCMHTFRKNKFPFIVQEEYMKAPSEFNKEGRGDATPAVAKSMFDYDVPSDEDVANLESYLISNELISNLTKKYNSRNNLFIALFRERIPELESLFEGYIRSILDSGRYISAFLTLAPYAFLERVAEKYRIEVINTELGSLRSPMYCSTAYFDIHSLYKKDSQKVRYEQFCRESQAQNITLLSSDELLSIVLNKPYLGYIEMANKKPKYKIGIALGYTVMPLYQAQTYMDDQEILWTCSRRYKPSEMLVRKHPGDMAGAQYLVYDYCRDVSPNTIDFVLKCETVVSLGSNVSFEAMLFKRSGMVFVDCPASFMARRSFDEPNHGVVEEEYLNFFVLCYLVPFRLFWNTEYLKWRLTKPTEKEIYDKHLAYYLAEKGIPKSPFEIPSRKRYGYLMAVQGYDSKQWKPPAAKRTKFTPKEYQNEIDRLKAVIEEKNKEISTLKNGGI